MPFKTELEHEDVYHLGDYHPYWSEGRKNPKFDAFSGKILDVKSAQPDERALVYFAGKIGNLVKPGVTITVVPGHDPVKIDSGIRTIAQILALDDRIDATSCLVRHKKIEKLATGGSRHPKVHHDSIVVRNINLIKGANVLLLDDVSTSNNSILVCKELLLKAGAAKVTCFALGQTVR